MESTTYSQFRQNLKKYMNQVNESHAPVYVTRSNQEDVVMLSKADYEGMQETLYLLSSSENAQRLYQGIKEYEEGKAVDRDLIKE
jgi:antitoxin YefM